MGAFRAVFLLKKQRDRHTIECLSREGPGMKLTILCIAALLLSSCGLAMSDEDRLDRAEEALAAEEYRAAIIDAKDVLRGDPENIRGRLLLGRASAAIGDGAAAEKELRRALDLGAAKEDVLVSLARALLQQRKFQEIVDEIQPDELLSIEDRAELKLIRGDAFMGLGQPRVARELYSDVLEAVPANVGGHLGMAASYRAENDVGEARRVLDNLKSMSADEVRGWLASAELHLAVRNLEDASAEYEKAAEIGAGNEDLGAQVQALTGLAEAQFALGDIEGARGSVDRVAELAPESFQHLFLMSRIAYLDEDWTTAQQNLQRILQRVPEYRPAQTLLGTVHLRQGNLTQAEMYLSAVVVAEPENDQARRLLAETKLQLREVGEAEATLAPLVASSNPTAIDLAMAARASFGQGDADTAIDLLRRSVEEDPANTDLKFQLAIALMNEGRDAEFAETLDSIDISSSRQDEFRRDMLAAMSVAKTGDLDQALVAAQELASDWPRNPNAHNFLGSVHAARDELEAATKGFETSLALQPGELTALRNLAALDERRGDVDSARLRYEVVLEGAPNSTWAMFGLARLAAREEDLAKSQEWLQRIRTTDDQALQPRASLAAMLITQGDFEEAEAVVAEAILVNDGVSELHNLLGRARTGQGDHAGASMAFERALELAPGNDQYRLNLANAQRRAGNEALAERTLLSEGSVNLDHLPTAITAASLKVDSGDLGGAMQIAKALQERHPSSPIPIALEAEIHIRAERLADANNAYDRALAIDVIRTHAVRAHQVKTQLARDDRREPLRAWLAKQPQDSGLRLILAESLQADGELDDAIHEYENVVKQDPSNAVALNNLAWTYYLAEDGRAAKTARRAFELMPDNGSVADTLGWILIETGDVSEGVSVLERAVELSNGRAEVRYHYAAGLAKLGKTAEARRILQDVVSSGAEFSSRADAERLLADL